MRSYGQYCGLARSLEIVGDRWNLLIVRQLLIGSARYRDLAAGLPGIATNLLAERLRDLEAAGVIERRLAHGATVEYALTPWGAQLREPIESLIRWSTPLMMRGPDGDTFRHEWLTIAIPALLNVRAKVRRASAIGLAIGEPALQLNASRSGFMVGLPDGRELAATLHAAPEYILGLAAGAITVDDGLVLIDGDEAVVRAIFDVTN